MLYFKLDGTCAWGWVCNNKDKMILILCETYLARSCESQVDPATWVEYMSQIDLLVLEIRFQW